MDFSRLFRLENKNNISEELEEISLKGKEDKEIRKIILDNFPKLFSYLELFNEGEQSELPVFQEKQRKNKKNRKPIKKPRPDSLAFCENENQLYILEYKSKIDEDILKQVKQYRRFIQSDST